jgi:hypothetical protein
MQQNWPAFPFPLCLSRQGADFRLNMSAEGQCFAGRSRDGLHRSSDRQLALKSNLVL